MMPKSVIVGFLLTLVGTLYFLDVLDSPLYAKDEEQRSSSTRQQSNVSEIKQQESRLAQKEKELELRELELRERSEVLAARALHYERTISSLRKEVSKLKEGGSDSVEQMIAVYSQMDAKPAAKILSEMDVKSAATILGSIQSRKAAEILGVMDPKKAKVLTELSLKKQ